MEGRCVKVMDRLPLSKGKCHATAGEVSAAEASDWSDTICPYKYNSLQKLISTVLPQRPSVIYLATDSERVDIDEEIVTSFRPKTDVKRGSSSMLVDMWVSVESDFHFGNPASSCKFTRLFGWFLILLVFFKR